MLRIRICRCSVDKNSNLLFVSSCFVVVVVVVNWLLFSLLNKIELNTSHRLWLTLLLLSLCLFFFLSFEIDTEALFSHPWHRVT